MVSVIEAIIRAQIPVIGHLGLTPQSVNVFGGYKVQGKSWKMQKNYEDALFFKKQEFLQLYWNVFRKTF